MTDDRIDRYEILKRLAVSGAAGEAVQNSVAMALRQAADLVGLQAAAMHLWDDKMKKQLSVSHADNDSVEENLASLEDTLFGALRQDRKLLSAYMTFGGEQTTQSFTFPLVYRGKVFGAVIGIQIGEKKLVSEDSFLEALCATIAINIAAEGFGRETELSEDLIERKKMDAITETAVAVNHEINNPLTAILGNVQLLLMKQGDIDEELAKKLKTIETSALKIRDVTQKLLRVKTPKSVPYADGTNMLDLSGDDDE